MDELIRPFPVWKKESRLSSSNMFVGEAVATAVLVLAILALDLTEGLVLSGAGVLIVALVVVAIASHPVARPATPSTPRVTSVRESCTRCCRSRTRAGQTGVTRGFRW